MSEDSIKNLDEDGQKALQDEIAKLKKTQDVLPETSKSNNKTLISTPDPKTEGNEHD